MNRKLVIAALLAATVFIVGLFHGEAKWDRYFLEWQLVLRWFFASWVLWSWRASGAVRLTTFLLVTLVVTIATADVRARYDLVAQGGPGTLPYFFLTDVLSAALFVAVVWVVDRVVAAVVCLGRWLLRRGRAGRTGA